MVTCLIGFMGILGFMGTITLSNRPWYSSLFTSPSLTGEAGCEAFRMVFFTFHFSLFTLSEAKLLSQENIHYCVGISHRDTLVVVHISCSHVEVRDA